MNLTDVDPCTQGVVRTVTAMAIFSPFLFFSKVSWNSPITSSTQYGRDMKIYYVNIQEGQKCLFTTLKQMTNRKTGRRQYTQIRVDRSQIKHIKII